MATARLFELLLSINPNPDIPGKEELSTHLSREKINSLPEATGVYYFYNENHDLIYIGKSKNISERVYQHLTNNSTKRALEMRQEIQDVDYEITGSELVALLKESAEIKEHQPRFNRAQRRTSYLWGIYSFIDQNGYINLKTARTNKLNETPLASFASKTAAQEFMHQLTRQHMLCQKLTGLYKTEGACFQYQIHQCRGACVGEERPETYNERLKQALERFDFEHSNFIAIDMGRRIDERAVVVVEKGLFKGYGFFDVEALNNGTDFIRENVKFQRHTRDAKQIIQSYLQHQKVERVIAF